MAHLDLEEQEQLDQFKHFWKQYGGLISWALIVLLAIYAGWNGWQYWQNRQAVQATALYEEVERIASGNDAARLDRALADMKDKFPRTAQAQQAAVLVAAAAVAVSKVKALIDQPASLFQASIGELRADADALRRTPGP